LATPKILNADRNIQPQPRVGERNLGSDILVAGISYRTTPIEVREAAARFLTQRGTSELAEQVGADEVVLLSTCNRLEAYMAARSPESVALSLKEALMRNVEGLTEDKLYNFRGREAVSHLFKVAVGADSIVFGEPQILAQVRAAGVSSRKSGTSKRLLSPLFDRASNVGRRVRSRFSLGSEEDSLSDLALEAISKRARKHPKVLVVGTGKMVQLAVGKLKVKPRNVVVASRRKDLPRRLTPYRTVGYDQISKEAAMSDVVISATTTDVPILDGKSLGGSRRRIVVDLGMPRNISPQVRSLKNVTLFDLDDLASMAKKRKSDPRAGEIEAAVSAEAAQFYSWIIQTRLSSTLADVYTLANGIRVEETEAALRKIAADQSRAPQVVEELGRRIVSKMMARPASFARSGNGSVNEEEKLALLGEVFGVNEPVERNNQDRD